MLALVLILVTIGAVLIFGTGIIYWKSKKNGLNYTRTASLRFFLFGYSHKRLGAKFARSKSFDLITSGKGTNELSVEKHARVRHWLRQRTLCVDSARLHRLPFSNTWCVATKDGFVIRDLMDRIVHTEELAFELAVKFLEGRASYRYPGYGPEGRYGTYWNVTITSSFTAFRMMWPDSANRVAATVDIHGMAIYSTATNGVASLGYSHMTVPTESIPVADLTDKVNELAESAYHGWVKHFSSTYYGHIRRALSSWE